MSSSTGLYKSRLFNLLNRQSIRLKDRWDSTLRHLKVTAEWGVQILLYPLYLLAQTGRVAGLQLEQTLEKSQLPPTSSPTEPQPYPVTADHPIKQVLKAIEPWLSLIELENKEETKLLSLQRLIPRIEKLSLPTVTKVAEGIKQSITQTTGIQGVASHLETHTLVLVTSENQTLDILPQEHQKNLQQRIRWEVANYWYEHRLAASAQKFPGLIPKFKNDRTHVLPPVRLFWKTMRWIQTSPVAIAVNLFGESTLVPPQLPLTSPPVTPTRIVTPLDHQLADLESKPLAPIVKLVHNLSIRLRKGESLSQEIKTSEPVSLDQVTTQPNFWQIQALIQNAVEHFFSQRQRTATAIPTTDRSFSPQLPESSRLSITTRFQGFVQSFPTSLRISQKSTQAPETSEPDPFRLQVLIQAAIEYFFGQRQDKLQLPGDYPSAAIELPPSPTSVTSSICADDDPWLSWEDLFSETSASDMIERESQHSRASKSSHPVQLPSSPQVPAKPGNSLKATIKHKLNQQQTPRSLQLKQPISKELTKSQNLGGTAVTPAESLLSVSQPQESTLEAAPDWLETEATSVGYVRHPLERVLEWLDQIMLWVEERIVKLWNWMRQGV